MSPVLFYVGPSLTVNRMIWRTEKWEGGGAGGNERRQKRHLDADGPRPKFGNGR